ncbi:hypothetical protein [Lacihabitans lacunae]|uniref:Uncharacterized protein n=1 Tax=Lacihabitans lacunae TaxID=1028214 RepID=A0ABV7YWF7_9BACT
MGTAQTGGPDKVAPHEHGMLEQFFLGLTDYEVVVLQTMPKPTLRLTLYFIFLWVLTIL